MDQLGIFVDARIGIVQPVDVGKDDQQIGAGGAGHQGRQRVVVAELEFVHGDRVVFVDHGNHVHVGKSVHGVAQIEIARAVVEADASQQDLCGRAAVLGEKFFVHLHQQPLPHRRQRLLDRQAGGFCGVTEAPHAGADRSRRNEQHVGTAVVKVGQSAAKPAHALDIDFSVTVRDRARADFDHYAATFFQLAAIQ